MVHVRGWTVVVAAAGLWGATAGAAPPERTLTVDPVELAAGREVQGSPDLSLEREGIEYRFVTAANRALFEASPAKYEVADGGACGRMGPLAGLGDARRYAVHAGRAYFFASDGCRSGFLKDPAKHVEADDPAPTGTAERVEVGRKTMDRLLAWAGGAERWKSLTAYRSRSARQEKVGEKVWAVTREEAVSFPGKFYQKDGWDDLWYTTVRGPEGGAMGSASRHEAIAESRARAFDRWNARTPVVIIKAHAEGSGLTAVGDGEGTADGAAVEWVKIGLSGASSRLAVEKATGRLVRLEFRGRDGTMTLGDSARTYTGYATVDGVTLPTAYRVTFDGKEAPKSGASVDAFEINPKLDAGLFEVKKAPDAK